jgi:hypothetical protein
MTYVKIVTYKISKNNIIERIMMKQAEMKYFIISKCFNSGNWKIIVDLDGQEEDREKYKEKLEKEYMVITKGGKQQNTYLYTFLHRPDIYAEDSNSVYIIEVEGGDPKQKETKIYSALGQIMFSMVDDKLKTKKILYGLAIPDNKDWIRVLNKLPKINVRQRLQLYIFLINSVGDIRVIKPDDNLNVM